MGRKQFLAGVATAGLSLLTGSMGANLLPGVGPDTIAKVTAGEPKPLSVNVLDYGADPTGKKDSSAAFVRALQVIENAAVSNPAANFLGDPNRRGRAKLYIPEGSYLLNRPETLMRRSYRTRSLGLVIQGAGRGLTQILFNNGKSEQYLLYNQDAWLFVHFADIEFTSLNAANNFMFSLSNGGAQNYSFERCLWNGKWNNLFVLEGSNTNSEMSWYHCNFNGIVNKGVFVSEDKGSDQFLNYNFFACQFEVEKGDFLVFGKGGNINIWGGSFIHYDDREGGTFFKLLGGSHAGGVQRFLCIGARFEHRNEKSKLIECEWNDGTLSFINCDMGSQAYRLKPSANARFRSVNQKMPSILFQSCVLMGKHEYVYLSNSWQHPHQIVYDNCELSHELRADEFIVYSYDGKETSRDGGRPLVKFRNCRSLQGSNETAFFDSDVGMRVTNRAMLEKKLISIKGSFGSFPMKGEKEPFTLPLGSLILNVKFICKPGAAKGLSVADYWLETSESSPSRLAFVQASPADAGFYENTDPMFECDTEAKRNLRLCSGSGVDQAIDSAFCLIEYIG